MAMEWDSIDARIYFSKKRDHADHSYKRYSSLKDGRKRIAHVFKTSADLYAECINYCNSKDDLISFLKSSDSNESEELISLIDSGKFPPE